MLVLASARVPAAGVGAVGGCRGCGAGGDNSFHSCEGPVFSATATAVGMDLQTGQPTKFSSSTSFSRSGRTPRTRSIRLPFPPPTRITNPNPTTIPPSQDPTHGLGDTGLQPVKVNQEESYFAFMNHSLHRIWVNICMSRRPGTPFISSIWSISELAWRLFRFLSCFFLLFTRFCR
jgi:hypothetical protein